MIELRTELTRLLKTYHLRSSFQQATDKTAFPYIEFDLPNSFDNEGQEVFNLDVDIWDDNEDTTEIETLASAIWKGLNHYHFMNENIQFSIYRENRLPPLDEKESHIKRRKLIFSLRYFDRN